MARVYLSSTLSDLQEHRDAASKAVRRLGHDLIGIESATASDTMPLDRSLADVRAADVFVMLVAWKRGYVPEGYDESLVELEYRTAVDTGIPCLVFMVPDAASWPVDQIDEPPDQIKRFRQALLERQAVGFFSSPDELGAKVATALRLALSQEVLTRKDETASGSGAIDFEEPPPPPGIPTLTQLLLANSVRPGPRLNRFMGLAAAVQGDLSQRELDVGEVTRSTTILVAGILDDDVSSALEAAGLVLQEFQRRLEIEDLPDFEPRDDILLHANLAAGVSELAGQGEVHEFDTVEMAIAALRSAVQRGGLVADRLAELGVEPTTALVEVEQLRPQIRAHDGVGSVERTFELAARRKLGISTFAVGDTASAEALDDASREAANGQLSGPSEWQTRADLAAGDLLLIYYPVGATAEADDRTHGLRFLYVVAEDAGPPDRDERRRVALGSGIELSSPLTQSELVDPAAPYPALSEWNLPRMNFRGRSSQWELTKPQSEDLLRWIIGRDPVVLPFLERVLTPDKPSVPGQVPPPADQTGLVHDEPVDAAHDELNRVALAGLVGDYLRQFMADEKEASFLVHVDGPWGSGKSTLLRFIKEDLDPQDDSWLAVNFDAWRESATGLPWPALLASLRREVMKTRRGPWSRASLWARELPKRFGLAQLIATSLFFALFVVSSVLVVTFGIDLATAGSWLGVVGAVASVAALAWTTSRGLARFMAWGGSSGSAAAFMERSSNPMEAVAQHFQWLVKLSPKPILYLVDDLDRCGNEYVVALLDAVQTLVRDAPSRSRSRLRGISSQSEGSGASLVVIVAADGRWLRQSYQHAHAVFTDAVARPGQPLGYLFLDKLFQLTVNVPNLSAARQEQFLASVLNARAPGEVPSDTVPAATDEELTSSMDRASDEQTVLGVLEQATPKQRLELAPQALERLGAREVQKSTASHVLQRYATLLPGNPRSMKRFVMDYGLLRGARTAEGSTVAVDYLARWAVLRARWPSLADHLQEHPDDVERIGDDTQHEDLRKPLQPLFDDAGNEVRAVLEGFDPQIVRRCTATAE